ncbi:hypothetical protein GDO86_005061 [Hymenochirus boettgeri]|uniref:Apoptosis facilitator Bcl-2-like protein 14 n=1 Tax=Hymenochirus boettgeri TaxID=247094 RepID=A0A8T2J356_9PIPI|nr:hypothetical protein GDO86_005061 [Hymenochirus boettgeri]
MVTVQESTMEEVSLCDEENSMEYKVLMAYAQRQLSNSKYQHLIKKGPSAPASSPTIDGVCPEKSAPNNSNGAEGNCSRETLEKPKKKKRGWRKKLLPSCIRAEKERDEKDPRTVSRTDDPETFRVNAIVRRLRKIVKNHPSPDESMFRTLQRGTSVEADGDDDNYDQLIKELVHILRTAGDQVTKHMEQDRTFLQRLRGAMSYDFFKKMAEVYLSESVPPSMTESEEKSSKLALCIDVTTRLTTLESQPMNKVLGFGAKYLKDNYSPWIHQQGGWEKVMGIQEEKEEEEEVE